MNPEHVRQVSVEATLCLAVIALWTGVIVGHAMTDCPNCARMRVAAEVLVMEIQGWMSETGQTLPRELDIAYLHLDSALSQPSAQPDRFQTPEATAPAGVAMDYQGPGNGGARVNRESAGAAGPDFQPPARPEPLGHVNSSGCFVSHLEDPEPKPEPRAERWTREEIERGLQAMVNLIHEKLPDYLPALGLSVLCVNAFWSALESGEELRKSHPMVTP